MNNNAYNLVLVFMNMTSLFLRGISHRGICLTVSFFLLAFSALANSLTSQQIENDFRNNPVFQPSSGHSRYQHLSTDFMEQSWSSNAEDLTSFYAELELEHKDVLGKPNYVPIGVGDITTIIPIYDKPRFIGSPVIQSRYIREQIRSLLGRNLIDAENADYANEIAQLNTLYRNAIEFIQYEAIDITYGDNLGLDQTASGLSQDIVWPEFRTINGEKVVVPIVYLTQATYEENRVTEHEINLNGSALFNDLIIDGVKIKLGRDAFLQASSRLRNYGGTLSGAGNLYIAVGGPLENLSGIIESKGDLEIGAHSIDHRTIVHRYDFGRGQGGRFGEIASISSQEGNVELTSYQDILIQGGIISAPAGSITFSAGGDILIGGVQYHESGASGGRKWSSSYSRTHILQSYLTAEDTISLIAEGEIKIDAAEIVSDQGHIELLAKLGITVEDVLTYEQYSFSSKFSKGSRQVESYKTVAMRSLLDAGKGIRLHTDYGDVILQSVDITSKSGTDVTADSGGIHLLTTVEHDQYYYNSISEGFFTVTSISRGHNLETAVPNTIVGGFTAEALYGVKVQYEGNSELGLDEQIKQISALPGMAWMLDVRETIDEADFEALELEYERWNEKNTSLSPAAIALISIVAAMAVGPAALEVGQAAAATSVGSFIGAGTTQAAVTAGLTTLTTQASVAGANGLVNGNFDEAMEEFITSDETWTSIATSMLTAGVIQAIDSQFFTPSDTDIQALADARGLGSITPGSLEYQLLYDELSQLSFGMQAIQVATHSAVRAGIVTAVYEDLEFDEYFIESVMQYGIDKLGQYMAKKIGEAFDNDSSLDQTYRYISHAVAGCVIGGLSASTSDSTDLESACVTGAGGAVVGEIVATGYRDSEEYIQAENAIYSYIRENSDFISALIDEGYTDDQIDLILSSDSYYRQQLENLNQLRSRGVDLSRLGAALAVFVAGADAAGVDIAANTGATAAQFNGLLRESYETVLEAINRVEREVANFVGITIKVENGGIALLPGGVDEFKRAIQALGDGKPIFVSGALHEFLLQVSGEYRNIALISGNGNQYSTTEILNIFTQFSQNPNNVASIFNLYQNTPFPSFIAVGENDTAEGLYRTASLALGGWISEQEHSEIIQLIQNNSNAGGVIDLSSYMSRAVIRTYFANENFLSEYQTFLNSETSEQDFWDAVAVHISVIPNGILESIGRNFETSVDWNAPPHMRSEAQRMASVELILSLPYKTIISALRGAHETVNMARLANEIAAAEVASLTERELFQAYLAEQRTLAIVEEVGGGATWYVRNTTRSMDELVPTGGIPTGGTRLTNWLDDLSAQELKLVLSEIDGGVWSLPYTARGRIIEAYLAKTDYKDWFNVGQLNNGWFPLVDFQLDTILVSVKSVNTTSSTWRAILGTLEEHIDDLAARVMTVGGEPVTRRILDIRVQPGGLDDVYQLIQYGNNVGVEVIAKEVVF